jgi:hypothetical protein
MLQVMQFASATWCRRPLRGVLAASTHDLTVYRVPFSRAGAIAHLRVGSYLAAMLPLGVEAILVLGVEGVLVALLRLGLRVHLAELTHVRAEVPARTALNSLAEVRAVHQAVFGQLMPNQLLETLVLLLWLGSRSPAQGPSH